MTLTDIRSPILKVHTLLCKYLFIYIFLLTLNSILSKIAFLWSHVQQNCLKISYYNCCDFTFKKVSLSAQQDTPWCKKPMLNSNLAQDINFTTYVPQKSVSIHSFWIVAFSILIVFVIMLENDDVFKLLIYLKIFFFSCVGILPPSWWFCNYARKWWCI